jgi:NAD-dependent DNA ligase
VRIDVCPSRCCSSRNDRPVLYSSVAPFARKSRGEASMSTELPFTKPPPTIDFVDRAFCFTGKFFSGTRSWCEEQVARRGAHCGAITRDLNFLIIGEIGSRDWIHSTHGRKIEKAIEYNERGCSIGIIGEQYWHAAL